MSRRLQPAASSSRISPGLLQRRRRPLSAPPDRAQPGPEPARGQDLVLDQARRLVPGAAQPVLGPVKRQRGPAGHVGAEVVAVRGLGPALPQRAERRGLPGQHHRPPRLARQDPLLLPFARVVRVMPRQQVGHPGRAPARVLLRQPGDPHRDQPDVLVAVQQRPGEPAGRPEADRRTKGPPGAAGRGDPLRDQPRLGRRGGLGEHHGVRTGRPAARRGRTRLTTPSRSSLAPGDEPAPPARRPVPARASRRAASRTPNGSPRSAPADPGPSSPRC